MDGHIKMLGLSALALCLGGCGDTKGEDDNEPPASAAGPLIMLVVDTSGSMERVADCECATPACSECLPDCSGDSPQKNRWTHVLEALTGSYEGFECEQLERTADFATYDLDYAVPHMKPMGAQRDDGVLDELADSVRFGVATFDPLASYGGDEQVLLADFDFDKSTSQAGMWSYPEADEPVAAPDGAMRGVYSYPGTPDERFMDTGIRNAHAEDGALIVAIDPSTAAEQGEDMQRTLLKARPYGGTPIASALDDVYWLFAEDPALDDERADAARERHVVLISDGMPDDDYRDQSCADDSFRCPYPLAEEAARNLRCGGSDDCDEGVATQVHVITLGSDGASRAALDAIADAGGTEGAIAVDDGAALKAALRDIIDAATEASR